MTVLNVEYSLIIPISIFFCLSRVLLIAKVLRRSEKTGSFVRKLGKLGFEWKTKLITDRPNSEKIPQLSSKFHKWFLSITKCTECNSFRYDIDHSKLQNLEKIS